MQQLSVLGFNGITTSFLRNAGRSWLFAVLLCSLFASCDKADTNVIAANDEIVYMQTNNFLDNQNAIIAYKNSGDGMLTQIAGSPFLTGGAGIGNPMQILGPDDSDNQIMISADKKFLLVTNAGSNTITVFSIMPDGSLTPVPGSPFPSGGQTPVSLSASGNYIYVANKSQDPLHAIVRTPNYTAFTIDPAGKLTQVPGATIETSPGSSPSQVLVSYNKKFLFGTDFLGFMLNPAKGSLRSFVINTSPLITPVTGTPYSIPVGGGALGLWQHPTENILYVGFPTQAKVGVYTIDPVSGGLSFVTSVSAGPAACWIRTNKAGNRLYSLNSAENTISVFNSSSAQSPVSMDKFALKNAGPLIPDGMGNFSTTSEDFSFEFSTDEKFMYVICQHTNTDFTIGNFNYFHVLSVSATGLLSEPADPLPIPVAPNVRPQGIAVYKAG